MKPSTSAVYRIENPGVALVREEDSRRVRLSHSKALVKRQAHGLVLLATQDGVEGLWPQWWYDLRRGRLNLVGGLLRYFDACCTKGIPEHLVQLIPGWLSAYVRDLYADRPTPTAASRPVVVDEALDEAA